MNETRETKNRDISPTSDVQLIILRETPCNSLNL